MQPSVRTLYAFVSEFGVTVDEVLFDQAPPSRGGRPQPCPSRPGRGGPGLAVQRADGRPAITLNSGVTWERLMFWGDEDVEFMEATYEPGGASGPADALVRHSGHEFGHVLSGTLRVVVGFDEFVLGPGDSITFPSSTPHRLSNEGTETARAIWVVRGRRGAESARRGVLGGLELRRRTAQSDERARTRRRRDRHQRRQSRAAPAGRRLGRRGPVPPPRRSRRADHAADRGSRWTPDRSPLPCAAPPRRTSSSRPGSVARPRPRTSTSTGACCRTCSTRPAPRSPSATSRSSRG